MTRLLKDSTSIPNWMMSIIVLCLVSVSSLGWKKIDRLEKQMIVRETEDRYEQQKLRSIEAKLDQLLEKVHKLEKNR